MISVRGLSRCLVNDQQRFARFDHYLAPADFRAFDESVEGLQRSQSVLLRVDSLDAFDCGLEREHQASHLRKVYCWIFFPSFSSELDACELVNGIPQQWCRIVFDGLNDAGKNHRKLHLQWSRRKVLSAADFLRLRGHVKARAPARQLPSLEPHVGSGDSGRVSLGRLSQYLILMGPFIAPPPIERRHTRQRIAEKPSRQIVRLELSSAVTIRQGQGTGPKAR